MKMICIFLLLVPGFVLPGCEQKQVYIPPEYTTAAAAAPGMRYVEQLRPAALSSEIAGDRTRASYAQSSPPAQEQFAVQPDSTADGKQPKKTKKEDAAKSPQRQASMQQVDQARGQLEKGRTDAAIHTLEKAIRIDAGNGEAFILLARAWKQKGEVRRALEFAKKAELLCRKQPARLKEVYSLESDLYRELEESMNSGHKSHQKTSDTPKKPQ
jgi:tetratricopeptide (TPR) repeat protein